MFFLQRVRHPVPYQGVSQVNDLQKGGVYGWGQKGGGLKLLCILRALCVDSDLGPGEFFFVYMDPLTSGRGPGSELQVPPVAPPPPQHGPLRVRTQPFSRWLDCLVAPKITSMLD